MDALPQDIRCPGCRLKLTHGSATPKCRSCAQQLLICYNASFSYNS